MSQYGHVVIGAGIVGSCTALYLARNGAKVVLLEQFPVPHTRGSSHGASRLIRSSYAEPHFAALMPEAIAMWKEIEELSGSSIIVQKGGLCIGAKGSKNFESSLANMQKFSPQNLVQLTTEDFLIKYPMLRYSTNYEMFLDKSTGVIVANRALAAVQDLFKRNGGHLWDGCKVTKIEPPMQMSTDYKVSTSNGYVVAPSVIICAGCWCKELLVPSMLPSIPLQPTAVKVFYWKDISADSHSEHSDFPSFIDVTDEKESIYGLYSLEYPTLVKVCARGGVPCDPDGRDKVEPDATLRTKTQEYIREHFPTLETTPSIVEDCMYTLTPDEDFILDQVPGQKNVVIGCGFSGTGFKTAPVVGKLLAELACGKPPSHDLTPFRLSRFGSVVTGAPSS